MHKHSNGGYLESISMHQFNILMLLCTRFSICLIFLLVNSSTSIVPCIFTPQLDKVLI